MTVSNKITACHHIKPQVDCHWCDIYKRQIIRKCDRCQRYINTDTVYLAIAGPRPQLLCIDCHLWELNERRI